MNPNDPQQVPNPQGGVSQSNPQQPLTSPTQTAAQPVIDPMTQPTQVQQPSQPQVSPMNGQFAPVKPKSKGLIIGIIVGVLVLLIAGGVLVYLMNFSKSHSHSSATNNSSANNSKGASSGASSSSGSTYLSVSACQVFTTSDAQGILGSDANGSGSPSATLKNNIYTSECTYNSASTGNTVIVLLQSAANSSGVSTINSEWSQVQAAGLPSVSGLGDGAYYNSSNEVLSVKKGNVIFDVSIGTSGDAEALDIKVAQAVLSNL